MKARSTILFILLITLFLISGEAFSQCAMCKANAEASIKAGENVAKGINKGILYLMAIPYLILFLFFRKKIFTFIKSWRARV